MDPFELNMRLLIKAITLDTSSYHKWIEELKSNKMDFKLGKFIISEETIKELENFRYYKMISALFDVEPIYDPKEASGVITCNLKLKNKEK